MSDGLTPIERILQRTARAMSGRLHPAQLLERVQSAVEPAVRDGMAPNQLAIAMNPEDYDAYEPAFGQLSIEVERLLDAYERRRGLRRFGDRVIDFERADAVAASAPVVTASFADTVHRAAPVAGATARIRRHRGVSLLFADGTRAQLTHTPFTIGRGPGNDLMIPSLAVSRQHAVITAIPGGFEITDLGSHNGVLVDGARHDRVTLVPGQPFLLGDTALRLEEAEQ
jgi:hypothetical protein